jgi:hypothetical protein
MYTNVFFNGTENICNDLYWIRFSIGKQCRFYRMVLCVWVVLVIRQGVNCPEFVDDYLRQTDRKTRQQMVWPVGRKNIYKECWGIGGKVFSIVAYLLCIVRHNYLSVARIGESVKFSKQNGDFIPVSSARFVLHWAENNII